MPGRSHRAWAALSAALKHYVLVCVQEFCVSFLMDTYSVAVFIEKRVHTGLAGADDPVVRAHDSHASQHPNGDCVLTVSWWT